MSVASDRIINKYIQHLRSSLLSNNDVGTKHPLSNNDTLSSIYRLMAICVLSRCIDEMIITNKGKRNIYVYEQIKCMKERFKQKQKLQMFVEKTLDPMEAIMDQMITVKLEEDMYNAYIRSKY